MTVLLPGAPFPIAAADTPLFSAFGHLNTSQAVAIFSSQQQYGDDATIWETLNAGTGTTTFLPNESTIQLSTGGTGSTASCIRQTRLYHRYLPGHSQQAIMTFCMDGGAITTNNTRRVGYYDQNNGFFLEIAGTTVNVVQRSYVSGAVVETRIPQANWSQDTFGAGSLNPSGITINWADTQILIIDLQWLGVGRGRFMFNINGVYYPAHYFNNANSKTTAYMTTANLPLRYENFNTGTASGTSTLRHICSAVTQGGGGVGSYGHEYAYSNTPSGLSITSGARVPVLSIQAATTGPNSVRNTGQISIQQYDTFINSLNAIYWQLVLNPTLTGASFTSYGSNSIANVDTSATALSGGVILDQGLIQGSSQSKGYQLNTAADLKQYILMYSGLLNHQDVITLACTAVGGTSVAVCGFQWLELW